jgi:arsenate reductase (thioredoxin)
MKADQIEPYSAGENPKGVDPRAIKAMSEAGVDISGQVSKHIDALRDIEFDYVITLCDNAYENCPSFPPSLGVVHKGFDDPPEHSAGAKTEEEAMAHYRRVRDEIREFVETLPGCLKGTNKYSDSTNNETE